MGIVLREQIANGEFEYEPDEYEELDEEEYLEDDYEESQLPHPA